LDANIGSAGGTYPALAVLFSKTLETFETVDVDKTNFFALMFFVVALGNLVLYAIAGWFTNIVAQVSSEPFTLMTHVF
jgi:ATP-binding cassette subfamily B (MDR/TAP) protein 1